MLNLLVEFIGTFLFFSVILKHGQAIPIAVALAAAIYFGGHISGGNFNPGVSLMMYLTDKLSQADFIQYVLVQALAAFSAVQFANLTATQ
jgi:aquaporin Z